MFATGSQSEDLLTVANKEAGFKGRGDETAYFRQGMEWGCAPRSSLKQISRQPCRNNKQYYMIDSIENPPQNALCHFKVAAMSVLIHTFWCSVSFSWGECRRWLPRCRPRCRNKETEREKANMCETDGKRQTCGDLRAILLQTHYQLFYSVLDFFRCPNINILTFLFFPD